MKNVDLLEPGVFKHFEKISSLYKLYVTQGKNQSKFYNATAKNKQKANIKPAQTKQYPLQILLLKSLFTILTLFSLNNFHHAFLKFNNVIMF